jgi:NDP-sugar pyrophosphorylase family protein
MAILAGGLGTRLGRLSENLPKALMPVAGRPFIHHQLQLLKKNGFERVVVLAGYLGKMIEESVGDGSRFNLKVDYCFDGPVLLGTGGAVKKALNLLPERFMIIYGDSYLDLNYRLVEQAYLQSGLPALMTVYRNEDRYDLSNVVFEEGVIRLYDKNLRSPLMRHIDYGLGCLDSSIFVDWEGEFSLAEVYGSLSKRSLLAGFLVEKRFYEIGSLSGLNELDAYLSVKSSKETR